MVPDLIGIDGPPHVSTPQSEEVVGSLSEKDSSLEGSSKGSQSGSQSNFEESHSKESEDRMYVPNLQDESKSKSERNPQMGNH
ncbi:hypothetical protein RDI58_013315 [Solanum bulbocastanum]|uniref:Uncharacterized protein n=1 Tax=Solanum bulbocastanum TaxID=147425 RepID=A0AAN8TKM3_SOLBU